jgi:hypothetical protein
MAASDIATRLRYANADRHCWYIYVAFARTTTEKTNACLTTAEKRAQVIQLGSTWVNLGKTQFTQVCS